MKIPQIAINFLIVGAIIYILIKLKQARDQYKIEDAIANIEAPQLTEPLELRPLNWSTRISKGSQGSEVAALQMMLQYYYPGSQHVNGIMDDVTLRNLKYVVNDVHSGDMTLYVFVNSYFSPSFPTEVHKVLSRFPNA